MRKITAISRPQLSRASSRTAHLSASPPDTREEVSGVGTKKATIFIDGSCINNGREGAKAGIGVYWAPNSSLNISEPLIGGPQTNQRAEIHSAIRGINKAREHCIDELEINLDSHYVKNAAESWIPNWERQGWTKELVNKQDFQQLRDSMKGIKVSFEYVPRADNPADSLAKEGALKH